MRASRRIVERAARADLPEAMRTWWVRLVNFDDRHQKCPAAMLKIFSETVASVGLNGIGIIPLGRHFAFAIRLALMEA
jgi:hypothetical protein